MASGAAGDPLAWRQAVVLWKPQASHGLAVTPDAPLGLAQVRHTKHGGPDYYNGPGTDDYQAVKGGEAYTSYEIRWEAILSGIKSYLLTAFPTDGALIPSSLAFGWLDDNSTPTGEVDRIQDAYIESLELGLDASGGPAPLTGSVSGFGGLVTEVTTPLQHVTSATFPWYSYEGVYSRAGAGYRIRSWSMTHANELERIHDIPAATPTNPRFFTSVRRHGRTTTGEISRYTKSGVNVHANIIPTFTAGLVLTSLNAGAPALTVAFSEMVYEEERKEQDPQGLTWVMPYRGKVAIS